MKKNMGLADRLIRLVVAATIAVLFFTGVIEGTPGIILLIVAVVFVITSLIRVCPLYMPFGIRTCAREKE